MRSDREKESDKAKELRARIRAIESQESDLREKRRGIEQELAEELAIFKIGDRVTYDDHPWVIAHIYHSYGKHEQWCFHP